MHTEWLLKYIITQKFLCISFYSLKFQMLNRLEQMLIKLFIFILCVALANFLDLNKSLPPRPRWIIIQEAEQNHGLWPMAESPHPINCAPWLKASHRGEGSNRTIGPRVNEHGNPYNADHLHSRGIISNVYAPGGAWNYSLHTPLNVFYSPRYI